MSTDDLVKGMSDNLSGTNGNRIKMVSTIIAATLTVLGLTVPPMLALATYHIQKIVTEVEGIKSSVADHEVRITKREANAYTIQQAQQERIRIDDRFASNEKLNATLNASIDQKLAYIQQELESLAKSLKEK